MSQRPLFLDYQDGSFRAVWFWVLDDDVTKTLYTATTIFEWKDVSQVQAWPDPNPLPAEVTPQEPKCVICWRDREVKTLASFVEVAAAWQAYRKKKREQKLRANRFSLN